MPLYFDLVSLSYIAYKCYIITLDDYPADLPALISLRINFSGLVQYYIHELVEADNLPLYPQISVLVQPDLDPRFGLEELEDQEL